MMAAVRAEWGRTWSVRAPWVTLAAVLVTVPLMATVLANDVVHAVSTGELPPGTSTAPAVALGPAVQLGLVVLAALAMHPVTTEYATGTARLTFQAEPRRWLVLAAKTTVVTVTALLAGVATGTAATFAVRAFLGVHAAPAPDGALAEALRAGLRTGVVLALAAILTAGIAAVVRHAVGTLALAAALLAGALLLPDPVSRWTPAGAVASFVEGGGAPWALVAWAVVGFAAAAGVLERRDA
ncbi:MULTISPECIES: hypothetical protein [Oerskovia]|uniref:ABC transporter permease n=1 Tax=Oerskovia rustica TaxID=2762237 RepID=A0ABR8RNK3_9CELL|nr:hypothetical protein [Oerskovia rustica]MBD7949355.1 hypothetical protein [Oerskovia rustica]